MGLKFDTSIENDKISFKMAIFSENDIENFYKSQEFFEMQNKLFELFDDNCFQLYFEIIYPNSVSEYNEKLITCILALENENFTISFLLTYDQNNSDCSAFMARRRPSPNSFFEIR